MSDVRIGKLFEECIELLKFEGETKSITLSHTISQDFPVRFVTDANRLKQIIINLLSNSIKYTKIGSVTAEASVDGEDVKLVVRDTGVGIDQDRVEGLFTAFTKVPRHRELN